MRRARVIVLVLTSGSACGCDLLLGFDDVEPRAATSVQAAGGQGSGGQGGRGQGGEGQGGQGQGGEGQGGDGQGGDGQGGDVPSGQGGDPGSGGGGGEPRDTTPPSIVSIEPANLAVGVLASAPVILVFSEPMDRASTESALQSSLPRATLTWNDPGDTLTIEPVGGLEYAEGTYPPFVAALRYSVTVLASAADLAGNALTSKFDASFTTARRIAHTLPRDLGLSNDLKANGENGCFGDEEYLCPGDAAANIAMKAFASFALDALPSDIIAFESASLRATLVGPYYGDPFATLGDLRTEHVSFTTVDLGAFSAAPLAQLAPLADDGTFGVKNVDVLAAVTDDQMQRRAHSQYRLSFTTATDGDGVFDYAIIQMISPSDLAIELSYLVP